MSNLLEKLVRRRHPRYEERLPHWDFVESTFEGGRDWFEKNLFRYFKEGETEFADRKKRAYRYNHTRQVLQLVNEYLFKVPATRKEDAPAELRDFWGKATRAGLPIEEFAKQVRLAASMFGRGWVVVDNNLPKGAVVSKADAKVAGSQVYAYFVRPQQVLDMSYDDQGELNWILMLEFHRDDLDPLDSSGKTVNRYRLWTRTDWRLFEEVQGPRGGKSKIEQIDSGEHSLGLVPVIPVDNEYSDTLYAAPGLADDIAYLDRSVANYLSNLDAIIQDQTFSQLAMPAQGLLPGEEGYEKALEAGTKRVFLFNGEAGNPFFLSPDPKQAELIIVAIGKIINEIYHSVGLAAERTKEDNGGGIDNASGVAKAYDFERVNGMLVAKADAQEQFEARLSRVVLAWHGVEMTVAEARSFVEYPRDFDVRGLYDEFEIAAQLSLLTAPDAVRREQMRLVIAKLFPAATDTDLKRLTDSLKSWPPPPELAAGLSAGGTGGSPLKAASAQKTAKQMTS